MSRVKAACLRYDKKEEIASFAVWESARKHCNFFLSHPNFLYFRCAYEIAYSELGGGNQDFFPVDGSPGRGEHHHLQAFVEFSSPVSFQLLIDKCPDWRIERPRNIEASAQYPGNEKKLKEKPGEVRWVQEVGKRFAKESKVEKKGGLLDMELSEIKDEIDSGGTEFTLWQGHFALMVRHHSGVRRYLEVLQEEKAVKYRLKKEGY